MLVRISKNPASKTLFSFVLFTVQFHILLLMEMVCIYFTLRSTKEFLTGSENYVRLFQQSNDCNYFYI